jgi:hypothetical protein
VCVAAIWAGLLKEAAVFNREQRGIRLCSYGSYRDYGCWLLARPGTTLEEAMNEQNDAALCAGPDLLDAAGERTDMLMTIGSGPRRSVRLARPPSPGPSAHTVLARFPRRARRGRA